MEIRDKVAMGRVRYGSNFCLNENEEFEGLSDALKEYGMIPADTDKQARPDSFKQPVEDMQNVDEALWEKSKRASQHAFGEVRWPFVQYFYKKQGGK
jgi:FPC/CPF motif-containing protein YcgG